MNNHYHLPVETPEGNLVEGMKWLQGTLPSQLLNTGSPLPLVPLSLLVEADLTSWDYFEVCDLTTDCNPSAFSRTSTAC
jgi:hypothetical protein